MSERVEKYFQDNPNIEGVHVTSDGFMFLKPTDAKNHAQTLEDKEIKTVYNPNLPDPENEDEDLDDEFEDIDDTSADQ